MALFAYRCNPDESVREFHVLGATDPDQYVESVAPDGTWERWERRERGDRLVFYPPPGYSGHDGMLWRYDPHIQRASRVNYDELRLYSINHRVSIVA